ncbi:hypothetical protein [Actinacidiphila soli]|uniref:hypothetical protein n=1 Tax=Actinacidiphila soli TaxID=2487275 RepID=UPI000FCBCB6B|nr:hypothetical protein [Actinacidiphila soli]
MTLLYTPLQSVGRDYFLAPPAAAPSVSHALSATDARWVELHAALISAGVPPLPGDSSAVHNIAQRLDDATVSAVVAWIDSAAAR